MNPCTMLRGGLATCDPLTNMTTSHWSNFALHDTEAHFLGLTVFLGLFLGGEGGGGWSQIADLHIIELCMCHCDVVFNNYSG